MRYRRFAYRPRRDCRSRALLPTTAALRTITPSLFRSSVFSRSL